MSNYEKKKKKIEEQIARLDKEMIDALTKKTSNKREISLDKQLQKMKELHDQLFNLK